MLNFGGGGGQNRFILCNAKLTNTGQPAHVHNYKLGDTMPESDAFYCVSFFQNMKCNSSRSQKGA